MPRAASQSKAKVEAVADKLLGKDTIGALTDKLYDLREQKRELSTQLDELDAKYREAEGRLFEKLEAEGTDKGSGKKASCSISVSDVAEVQNWDSFWAYIAKNKYFHLIQKRVSDPSVRELWDQGKKIPGVTPFSKRRLNLRNL